VRTTSSGVNVWSVPLRWLCLGAAALLLSSCANYRLGTGAQLSFATLYVTPVANDALVPQAAALITRELRAAFLRDGRVQLVDSPEAADATLTLVLVNYGRNMTTARPDDTGLARKFDLMLETSCTLLDQRTGTPIFDKRPIAVTRQVFTDGDGFVVNGRPAPGGQLPAEYQTLPLLAEQLAQRVTHAVLDVW
jgi:outer membrane lipopolysaccharide assembly protein LptE/RlpB